MDGREFLRVARDLMNVNSKPHRRGAAVHGYYAILLECRDVLEHWGLPQAPRYNVDRSEADQTVNNSRQGSPNGCSKRMMATILRLKWLSAIWPQGQEDRESRSRQA
jgi:hypothetical protein